MAKRLTATDANDFLYAFDASRDYDPWPDLGKVEAAVTAINSADDEVNPPELGILEREIKRVKRGKAVLLPIGPQTRATAHTRTPRLEGPPCRAPREIEIAAAAEGGLAAGTALQRSQEGEQGAPVEKAEGQEGFPRCGPLPVVGQDRLPESGRASVVQHPRLRTQAPERLCSHQLSGGAVLVIPSPREPMSCSRKSENG